MPAAATTLLIRTPEGILFSQTLAGPMVRCLAHLVDLAVILALNLAINLACLLLRLISADFAQAAGMLLFFAISVGYGLALEWLWRGQTLGKRALRLRVVDVQGLRLQFSQVVIRNLLRLVDMLPAFYCVGGIASLLNARRQRLGDLAANTVVVRYPKMVEPDLARVLGDRYNSLRGHPHLEARLRQRVSPAEASLALQALLRRDRMDPPARVELFAEMAAHFRAKVEFPSEALEGLADEQYVRNVLDLVHRPKRAPALVAKTVTAGAEPAQSVAQA